MRRRFGPAVLLALLLIADGRAPLRSEPSFPRESLDSRQWSYSEIEELCVSGALDSLWVYMRPLSRGDVARALVQSRQRVPGDPRVIRLWREFAPEIEKLDTSAAIPYTHPSYSTRADGSELWFRTRVQAGMSREAEGYWRSDPVTLVTLRGTWAYAPHFLFSLEMLGQGIDGSLRYAEPFFPRTEITTLAGQTYASASFAPFEITLGRDRLNWGIGQTGSLILGDAAPWLTFVEYGAHWKRLHARVFTSQLDALTGNYLSGHRIEWRAHPKLQLNFSETARYESRQPDLLYLLGIMPYQVIQKVNNAQAPPDTSSFHQIRNNIMIALDGFWRPRPGVQVGGAYLIDELRLSRQIPGRTGYQVNLLLTSPISARPISVRTEFTSIRNYVYSVFYHEDYSFQGVSLAYPLGPDVRYLKSDVRWDVDPGVRLWASGSHLWKGEGSLDRPLQEIPGVTYDPGLQGVVEKTLGGDLGARWQPRDNVRLELELGVRRIRNAAHVEGVMDTQAVGHVLADVHW